MPVYGNLAPSLGFASGANLTLGARACGGDDVVRISSECTSSEIARNKVKET